MWFPISFGAEPQVVSMAVLWALQSRLPDFLACFSPPGQLAPVTLAFSLFLKHVNHTLTLETLLTVISE